MFLSAWMLPLVNLIPTGQHFLVRRRAKRGQVTSVSLFALTGSLELLLLTQNTVNNQSRRNLGKSTNSSNFGAFWSHTRIVAFQQVPRLASPFIFPFSKARIVRSSPSCVCCFGALKPHTVLRRRRRGRCHQRGCRRAALRHSERWNQQTLQSEMWPQRDSRRRRPNQTDTLPALRPQRAIHHRKERLLGRCFSLLASRGAKWRGVFHLCFCGLTWRSPVKRKISVNARVRGLKLDRVCV